MERGFGGGGTEALLLRLDRSPPRIPGSVPQITSQHSEQTLKATSRLGFITQYNPLGRHPKCNSLFPVVKYGRELVVYVECVCM